MYTPGTIFFAFREKESLCFLKKKSTSLIAKNPYLLPRQKKGKRGSYSHHIFKSSGNTATRLFAWFPTCYETVSTRSAGKTRPTISWEAMRCSGRKNSPKSSGFQPFSGTLEPPCCRVLAERLHSIARRLPLRDRASFVERPTICALRHKRV